MGSWPWQAMLAQQASPADENWGNGVVRHLLPTVNDSRLLLKTSFTSPLANPPRLRLQAGSFNRLVEGRMNDTAGEFWQFYIEDLPPATRFELSLFDANNRSLCDSWPLSTFPEPGQDVERARLLFYTCAGGPEGGYQGIGQRTGNLPTAIRNRILRRALSFAPDAVIANGDHIYWDLHTWQGEGAGELSPAGRESNFDFNAQVYGGHNEKAMKAAVNPQIIPVYGNDFRSTPVFFIQDDHDHWENDSPLTYPVPWFQLQLARATQQLYYPEFLADVSRPSGLPWSGRSERGELSESFGTLRYGNLVEVLMYDVRRTLQVGEMNAAFLDPVVERWLAARTASRDTRHLVHAPSNPPGWSAGKWGEWYPDMLHPETNQLTLNIPKPQWQRGWLEQHDRIMQSLFEMRHRAPLVITGDLHATGVGTMYGAGNRDFSANPITTILSGPIGTSIRGFPSVVRNTPAKPSLHLQFDEQVPALEEHGFTLVDFTPDRIEARLFKWDVKTQPLDAIDTMQSYHTVRLG
ncbi:MAG: alkaline phosphatase D family protein [Gammaproteobacteria bacterium]